MKVAMGIATAAAAKGGYSISHNTSGIEEPHSQSWSWNKNSLFPNPYLLPASFKFQVKPPRVLLQVCAANTNGLGVGSGGGGAGGGAKGSGTTARGRRLVKIREEKRKREYDRLHNYPAWAK